MSMSAYPTCEILVGDCLEWLRTFPDNHFHCVVTSPPYYGLRDYGVAGQIGLEETPAAFLAKMVEVFREVRRVLREDGTCWVNMGDSYATTPGQQGNGQMRGRGIVGARGGLNTSRGMGFKPKDLMGMPWRLAFALQDDGWWLRQDIIWSKPNPMPESVTDRCCKSHEYLFLLTKRARYHWDAAAIKEPVSGTANVRGSGVNPKAKAPEGWDMTSGQGGHGKLHKRGRGTGVGFGHGTDMEERKRPRQKQNESFSAAVSGLVEERNKRSVWTVPTYACKEAHFATYPPDLIKPCILAGCPQGGRVLDPFGGSGTTGMVALELGRSAVLIELNPEYAEIGRRRTNVTPGML